MALYDAAYIAFLELVALTLCVLLAVYRLYTHREAAKTPLPLSRLVRPVTFSFMAATVGTQSVLQSKCIAEVIKSSSYGQAQQSLWFVGVVLAVFLGGLCVWLVCLNEALKLFDGPVIIPLLQGACV